MNPEQAWHDAEEAVRAWHKEHVAVWWEGDPMPDVKQLDHEAWAEYEHLREAADEAQRAFRASLNP